jgi:arylsulfatase A-like enzyme
MGPRPFWVGTAKGKRAAAMVALLAAVWGTELVGSPAPPAAAAPLDPGVVSQPPNVLLLISDDQSWSNFNRTLMPNVFGELVDRGVVFPRAYVDSSLCCPSRAEIMTGLYEHHTGVDTNDAGLVHPTIINALKSLGYRTALAGKYLNSWPCTPRPEFDEWACMGHGKSTYSLTNPTLNINGTWTKYTGYTTDILADRLVSFMNNTPADQPFFGMYSPTSPHLPANDDRCSGYPVAQWRPPSYGEDTISTGKPAYMRRPPLGPTEVSAFDGGYTTMTQAVSCLDGSMGTILDGLGSRAANTLVFYISDNGFLFGEHSRVGKGVPYEEATRVPFAVRFDPWLSPSGPFASDALVQNIDIAATIAEAVGFRWSADGVSLAPLIKGQVTSIRSDALLEGCQGLSGYLCTGFTLQYGRSFPPPWAGVVTTQDKYVEYANGDKELYDLVADPDELVNRAGDPAFVATQANLASRLSALRAPSPVDTTIATGPSGTIHTRVATFTFFSQSRYATYQCRLDVNGSVGAWGVCNTGSKTVGPLAAGNYTFRVVGKDENGHQDSTPDARSFEIHDTGPPVSIDSGPAAQTKNRSGSLSFSSPEPGVTFTCSRLPLSQSPVWQSCTSPQAFSNVPDAVWLFQVKAIRPDQTETDPPAQRLFKVDNVGPEVLFKQNPGANTQSTAAHFRFTPQEAIKGTLSCKLDSLKAVKCSDRFDVTGLAQGAHVLDVKATDPLGNKRDNTFRWTVDRTAPVLTVNVPGTYSKSDSATVSWTANEPLTDPVTEGIGRSCALDGVPIDPFMCNVPETFTGLPDGPHTFVIQVVDLAGNVSAATQYTWTVDTAAPVITMSSGPNDPTSTTAAEFAFSAVDTTPVTYKCSADGAVAQLCQSGVAYSGLTDGPHTFSVTGVDAAGNVSDAATYTWTIDSVAPETTIASGPDDPTPATTAEFTFSAVDATPTTFECSMDGGAVETCDSGVSYAALEPGSHTFVVVGTDAAGNVGAPAQWVWTVE